MKGIKRRDYELISTLGYFVDLGIQKTFRLVSGHPSSSSEHQHAVFSMPSH